MLYSSRYGIHWERITPHGVFTLIQKAGGIDDEEMRRIFNMGIGLVLVMAGRETESALSFLKDRGEDPHVIGEVI